ncbi:type IV secretory system conjugative DNA transfer family protein [Holdemania filiformis]|nr:type IV secretion system DNA-binding domain-containing protein [Holdemania filiformis]MBS5002913.1 type IV secretion system DNA-binding domain-containing protein [Holdemania filiformis]
MKKSVCFEGMQLQDQVTITSPNPQFVLNGLQNNQKTMIPIDENLLSKHMLLLGGIGTGKSNLFYHLIRGLRYSMKENDIMIIFDAKGDYFEKFYKEGDIVISNDAHSNVAWNIFEEVMVDERWEENIMEITRFLFAEKSQKTNQIFFPNAARDLLTALMLHLTRSEKYKGHRNNRSLRNYINSFSIKGMKAVLKQHKDLTGMTSYIENPDSGQAMGVVSELQQTIREILIGNFKEKGDFSIRKQLRKGEKKVIFIEFDLGIGKTLSPIYSLLIDLAIKEALCRKEKTGSIYFVLDEFRLLAPLMHMDNGVNFGRSLGAKFLIGAQNIEQVFDVYGEKAALSILSGFSTTIAFRLNDFESRNYIKNRIGQNTKMITYMSKVQTKGIVENVKEGNVVEDWNLLRLNIGEAVVQSLSSDPFIFYFNEFVMKGA